MTFFVTGANSGIGRALVEALAARGVRIVLATRSEARTRPVLEAIRARHPEARAQWVSLDVSDLTSVRRAADAYLASGDPIDVLVNNAGIAGTRALSPDGFDLTYATNHIGPFLLTTLLLPRLRESPGGGRVVNVASAAHLTVKRIDWSVLERRATPTVSGFGAYAVTKLMNVLHARELARRLAGTRVTTYALHPGMVATNIWRAIPPLQWLGKLFMLSSEEGARTSLYCATAPEVAGASGRYYDRCREAPASPLADDAALARELWVRTEAAVLPIVAN